jgi:chemotaxis methyl-accepting protein methylase
VHRSLSVGARPNDDLVMKEMLNKVGKVMSENYQTDISMFDDSFLAKTIAGRVNELSLNNRSEYVSYLKDNQPESDLLRLSLNNSFSEFFRNPLTFLMIEQLVLPKIFRRKENDKSGEIRIWSAGCAAGQEPYSIAILAEDYRLVNHLDFNIRIFGTDISQKELSTASKGIFHFRSLQNTRLYHIIKYFSNSGEFYSINSNIKEVVDFSLYDLLDENPGAPPSSIYGDFDIVMCSNLLFYYKPDIQKIILTRLSNSLVPGGFLITGEAEVAIVESFRGFKQLADPAAIFTKT